MQSGSNIILFAILEYGFRNGSAAEVSVHREAMLRDQNKK